MPSYQKKHEICAYSMQRDKIKGESEVAGVGPESASTQRCADTASDTFRGKLDERHPHGWDEPARKRVTCVGKEDVAMTDKTFSDAHDGAPLVTKALGATLEAPPQSIIKIDVAKYQAWLDDPALSDQQREQILEALWQIIVCFVDLGFGVSPLDDACGKLEETEGFRRQTGPGVVDSEPHTLSETFNEIAAK